MNLNKASTYCGLLVQLASLPMAARASQVVIDGPIPPASATAVELPVSNGTDAVETRVELPAGSGTAPVEPPASASIGRKISNVAPCCLSFRNVNYKVQKRPLIKKRISDTLT